MTGHVAMIQQSSKKTDKKSKYHSPILATMIWPFLFSNFLIVLVDGSGWKEGKEEEQTSQRWRIVSPATAGEKKCLLLPDAVQMLRCTRKVKGLIQLVPNCKDLQK